ncbi:MAG: flagellar basal body P-ring protein FlgI [Phycisphaeraceae bacterium]|nr:flagellar basal body P-ring protein FlgI [Phycisphaeraceae bacterium]
MRWMIGTVMIGLLMLAGPTVAWATQLQNLARIKGSESRTVVGMGLVVGLSGTGDSNQFLPRARSLAGVLQKMLDESTLPVDVSGARNVAVVMVSATIPATGIRSGDRIDVRVSSVYDARSLEGGELFLTPLIEGRDDSPVFAMASGRISIEDERLQRTGFIKDGARAEVDILAQTVDAQGRINLVLDDAFAGWTLAANLANLINNHMAPDGPEIAVAHDQRNVLVRIPEADRANPATFISRLMQLQVHQSLVPVGARVRINEQTGTIVISGDVQISPVIITHEGLTISTIVPEAPATPENPQVRTKVFHELDPAQAAGRSLVNLVAAFNQLQVPVKDRIAIIRQLHANGNLVAELVFE